MNFSAASVPSSPRAAYTLPHEPEAMCSPTRHAPARIAGRDVDDGARHAPLRGSRRRCSSRTIPYRSAIATSASRLLSSRPGSGALTRSFSIAR